MIKWFFVFGGIGIWTQDLVLKYSTTGIIAPALFAFIYFSYRVFSPRISLRPQSSYLSILLGLQLCSTMPVKWWDRVLLTFFFLPELALNHNPPISGSDQMIFETVPRPLTQKGKYFQQTPKNEVLTLGHIELAQSRSKIYICNRCLETAFAKRKKTKNKKY
jgi:hypothetical protein